MLLEMHKLIEIPWLVFTMNRIDFDTLEKLCRYLNCEVGELLEIADDVEDTIHTSSDE